MREQIDIFLKNDQHSKEILQLVEALGLAYQKLSPILSSESNEAFNQFFTLACKNTSTYLDEHIEKTTKEVLRTKSN